MVLFTYLFVQNLDAGSESASGTTSASGNGEGTTSSTEPPESTTSTTLSASVEAYLTTINAQRAQVTEFDNRAVQINDDWDRREETGVDFNTTLAAMQQLRDDVAAFREAAQTVEPPISEVPGLATPHQDMLDATDALRLASVAMIEGLRAPDTGEARLAALEEFGNAATAFFAAADAVEAAA